MLLFSKLRIYGHSMMPELSNNDLVIVSYLPYLFKKPKVTDIVAIDYNKKILIKRIRKINGNKYLVMGDNKNDSLDSRSLGYIAAENILGKVIYKFK